MSALSGYSVEAKDDARNLWLRFVASQLHNAFCSCRLAFG